MKIPIDAVLIAECVDYAGMSTYSVDSDVDQLRAEIMKHGPVEVDFTVYADFLSYKSGEHRHMD